MKNENKEEAFNLAKKILDEKGSELAEIAPAVLKISKELNYPVIDFQDFITKIGDKRLVIAGFTISTEMIKDLECLVPRNSFPVQNEQDLIEKFSKIMLRELKKSHDVREEDIPSTSSTYFEPFTTENLPQEFRNLVVKIPKPSKIPKPLKGMHENTGVLRMMDD